MYRYATGFLTLPWSFFDVDATLVIGPPFLRSLTTREYKDAMNTKERKAAGAWGLGVWTGDSRAPAIMVMMMRCCC